MLAVNSNVKSSVQTTEDMWLPYSQCVSSAPKPGEENKLINQGHVNLLRIRKPLSGRRQINLWERKEEMLSRDGVQRVLEIKHSWLVLLSIPKL